MTAPPFLIEPAGLAGSGGDPRLGFFYASDLFSTEAFAQDDFLETHVPGAGFLDPAVLSELATRGRAPGSLD